MIKGSTLLAALPMVAAFPWAMEANSKFQERAADVEPGPRTPNFKTSRSNVSPYPASVVPFDAEDQFVNVGPGSGHEFQAPSTGDLRGECPGLNAAANHGFLPRNGKPTIQQTADGLAAAFNMSPLFGTQLAIISVALAGDILTRTWSIGGPYDTSIPLLTGKAQGILGTHNQYEGDGSFSRGDAYLNGGQVGVWQDRAFTNFYNMAEEYDMDMVAAHQDYTNRWSRMNNPYFLSMGFSGLVAPGAEQFPIAFMSNHSAEVPGGTLTRETLKTFFAVEGEPGSFVQNRGQERIPDNWYRRPSSLQYNLETTLSDLFENNFMYPGIVNNGGNTGKVNTFTGVDTSALTGGVLNAVTLAEGNNAACFFMQTATQGLPHALDPALGAIGSVLNWATQEFAPMLKDLGCPQITYNKGLFKQFPGYAYKAQGQ